MAANVLFLPSFVGRDVSPINPPAWSLLMEFGANWLMALGAIRRSTRGLAVMLAVMALALVVDMGLTQALTPFDHGASVAKMGYRWHDVHLGVVRTMFSFLFGMVLSRLLAGQPHRSSRWALAALVAVPVLLMVPLAGWRRFAFDLLFIVAASPALVWAGARLEVPVAWRGVSERLGDLSYPLYAVHYFWTYPVLAVAVDRGWPLGLSVAVFVAASLGSAELCAKCVDLPVRRRLGRVLHRVLAQK